MYTREVLVWENGGDQGVPDAKCGMKNSRTGGVEWQAVVG